jgi:hypothetical protein
LKSDPLIDEILSEFKPFLKDNFSSYRNHCQRVFHLAMILYDGEPKPGVLSIAIAFHDLGIWTESTFDYLEPSIQLSGSYLEKKNIIGWASEVETIIDQHHKIKKYQGPHQESTEAVRKADLIDLTMGFITKGIEKKKYRTLVKEFPYSGFHPFLVKTSIKWFFGHPLNPFPMYKW